MDHALGFRQKLRCPYEVDEKPYARMAVSAPGLGLRLVVSAHITEKMGMPLLSVNCFHNLRRTESVAGSLLFISSMTMTEVTAGVK